TDPFWVPKANIVTANKANIKIEHLNRIQAVALVMEHRPTPTKDIAIERVSQILKELSPEVTEEQILLVRERLTSDPVFESACK
ncbi:MAG: hypothetical protein ABSE63_12770, partial [Thermoguttaceae bacterium]